jgi:hypothetical protein
MDRFKRYMPSPAMWVACVALVMAMTGAGFAATTLIGGGQVKNNSLTGADVKNRSLRSQDFNARDLAKLKGKQGLQGIAGIQGIQGIPGPFLDTLPSGKSLKGAFALIGHGIGRTGEGISFGIPLASAPVGHYIAATDPPLAVCPGTPASPAAAPGHLCIYEAENVGPVNVTSFEDPITGSTGSTTRTFGIDVVGISAAAGNYRASGSWAVTAP